MPTQYIKTLGALTINDGDPTENVNITTGGTGNILINGVVPGGGGGGGGGDVFLAGNPANPGAAQVFTGTGGNRFDTALVAASAPVSFQALGTVDCAESAGQTALKISDGGNFEMLTVGGLTQKALFNPASGSYQFGIQENSQLEATVEVHGVVDIKNNANTVIKLNGQGAGANTGLVQATSYIAEGGTYRGLSGGTEFVNLSTAGNETTGVASGNSVAVRTGAIGARTTHLSYVYDAPTTQVIERIHTAGNQKITSTAQAPGAGGSGTYKLSTQTQRDTIFHMPPTIEVMNNYQMNAYSFGSDIQIDVTDAKIGAGSGNALFSLGSAQTVWTSQSTVGTNVPVVATPYPNNSGSLPFGRYRLILRQKQGAIAADDLWTNNIIQGLVVSEELLYTGYLTNAGAEFANAFNTHRVDHTASLWSANSATGKFPHKQNSDGIISMTHQSALNLFTYYLSFTDYQVNVLQQTVANPKITFEAHVISLPMLG